MADGIAGGWKSAESLAFVVQAGEQESLRPLANQMARACSPVSQDKLAKRLGLLGMTMAPNRPEAEATAWVHETTRLLSDIAEDILFEAIDQHQRTNKFLPQASEIRAIAEPLMEKRKTHRSRLDAMARYLESGQPIPIERKRFAPPQDDCPLTPAQVEEWNGIMEKAGALTRYRADGTRYDVGEITGKPRHVGPPRRPTRADYIAMGVDSTVLDGMA